MSTARFSPSDSARARTAYNNRSQVEMNTRIMEPGLYVESDWDARAQHFEIGKVLAAIVGSEAAEVFERVANASPGAATINRMSLSLLCPFTPLGYRAGYNDDGDWGVWLHA